MNGFNVKKIKIAVFLMLYRLLNQGVEMKNFKLECRLMLLPGRRRLPRER
jgi:hypothetical protein